MMLDRLRRPLRDLRISVTDRCNLRCPYCMPREVFGGDFPFLAREELLSFEEITRIVRAMSAQGATKVRLTGGEPLLRRDLERLVEMLAAVDGVSDVALTTNGLLLARSAQRLRDAGLDRVTVSLDALEASTLRSMSDAPVSPERILAGIEAAGQAGLTPVKVNMVVRRGHNDHCVLDMADRFRHRPEILRFIEFMDVGSSNGWSAGEVVTAGEILAAIGARWPLEALAPAREGEVATRYRYRDGAGEIGLIHSVSEPFCGGCTRARLSADGQLFTCLFARHGHDLRSLLRGGAGADALERRLHDIWTARSDRYSAERSLAEQPTPQAPKIEMSYIGG
jgi:cyclic pyranopterin phosphate synthase